MASREPTEEERQAKKEAEYLSLVLASAGRTCSTREFVPQFPEISHGSSFCKLYFNKVAVEAVTVDGLRVTVVVKVRDIGNDKRVSVRYTTSGWRITTDGVCELAPHVPDRFSELYIISFNFPLMRPGDKLEFKARYVVNGTEYVDDNDNKNYVLLVKKRW